jgi:hypothetical protein
MWLEALVAEFFFVIDIGHVTAEDASFAIDIQNRWFGERDDAGVGRNGHGQELVGGLPLAFGVGKGKLDHGGGVGVFAKVELEADHAPTGVTEQADGAFIFFDGIAFG